MGLKILKSRVVRPWGVWVVTLVLLILALVSFVIHPSVALRVGIRSGITHNIVLEEGSLIYERYRHEMVLSDAGPRFTEAYLSRLDQQRWDLNWRSGWREFELVGIGPIRNPVWRWFFPSRPFASSFTVPLVLPLMLFGVLSFYSALEERRRRRVLTGLCGGCAYSLASLISVLEGEGECEDESSVVGSASAGVERVELPMEIPLINKVTAGYPGSFTDLGYPARVADEYVRAPDVHDPDAFAARVVGDSMEPMYREGDIVVFSPAKVVESGMDCFVRLEPDHETTFKRVYFEEDNAGNEVIRIQPMNSAYGPMVVERERVAGLYAGVSVTRTIG